VKWAAGGGGGGWGCRQQLGRCGGEESGDWKEIEWA